MQAAETRTGTVKDGLSEDGMAWLEFEDGAKIYMDSFGARQIADAAASYGLLFLPGVKMVYETDEQNCLTWFDFTS